MSQFFKYMRDGEDSGAIFVFAALCFFAVFALIGLAVDVGRLHRTQAYLQRAVDAGSVGATYLLQDYTPSSVRDTAERIIMDNLVYSGINPDPAITTVTVTLDDPVNPRSIQATATTDVPLILLNLVPFIGQDSTIVAANAVAGSVRLYVSLALDFSGSMCFNQLGAGCSNGADCCDPLEGFPACIQPGGSCALDCDADANCEVCDQNGNCSVDIGRSPCMKLVGLRHGVSQFIDMFQDDDYLAIVRFSRAPGTGANDNRGEVIFNMQAMDDTAKNNARAAVLSQWARGCTRTNASDGIKRARNEFIGLPANEQPGPNDFRAIILFTDGAPWSGDTDADELPGPGAVPGTPGSCTIVSPPVPILDWLNPPPWGNPAANWHRVVEDRRGYLNTIAEADRARVLGIPVYTIGLGFPHEYDAVDEDGDPIWEEDESTTSTSPPCDIPNFDDPYQGPTRGGNFCAGEGHIKEYFLARVANDQEYMIANEVGLLHPDAVLPIDPQPDFEENCVASNDTAGAGPEAKFYTTTDPSSIGAILEAIGSSIKARLVQ